MLVNVGPSRPNSSQVHHMQPPTSTGQCRVATLCSDHFIWEKWPCFAHRCSWLITTLLETSITLQMTMFDDDFPFPMVGTVLGGGFNPIENINQNGNLPQSSGWNKKRTYLSCHHPVLVPWSVFAQHQHQPVVNNRFSTGDHLFKAVWKNKSGSDTERCLPPKYFFSRATRMSCWKWSVHDR